ncbi:MAG: hypothetical protein HY581_08045 [Nitrospirae bacterium]|nr:hypothetical protein [Nitrospirota bacterium]
MGTSGLVFDELVSQIASKAVAGVDESRTEPVIDRDNGRQDGLLVESSLERVVVFSRKQATLSLSDISHLRRMMARAQARRALLYVPLETTVSNPVMLLATLSKIEIVRLAAAAPIL